MSFWKKLIAKFGGKTESKEVSSTNDSVESSVKPEKAEPVKTKVEPIKKEEKPVRNEPSPKKDGRKYSLEESRNKRPTVEQEQIINSVPANTAMNDEMLTKLIPDFKAQNRLINIPNLPGEEWRDLEYSGYTISVSNYGRIKGITGLIMQLIGSHQILIGRKTKARPRDLVKQAFGLKKGYYLKDGNVQHLWLSNFAQAKAMQYSRKRKLSNDILAELLSPEEIKHTNLIKQLPGEKWTELKLDDNVKRKLAWEYEISNYGRVRSVKNKRLLSVNKDGQVALHFEGNVINKVALVPAVAKSWGLDSFNLNEFHAKGRYDKQVNLTYWLSALCSKDDYKLIMDNFSKTGKVSKLSTIKKQAEANN